MLLDLMSGVRMLGVRLRVPALIIMTAGRLRVPALIIMTAGREVADKFAATTTSESRVLTLCSVFCTKI